jgi:ATP-binding cassette subfamily G (WHITE) protein 2 (SNQ2)
MICTILETPPNYEQGKLTKVEIVYEFLYTSLGQAIAAYAPNEYFAAIMNPVIIGAGLISFCGVVVPYSQMQPFWRYWIYYLDPFTYLVGGLLGGVLWDVKVECAASELVHFSVSSLNQTCGEYMADFLATQTGYLVDPRSTSTCSFCQYETGADYAKTFNLTEKYYSWRDVSLYSFAQQFVLDFWLTGFLDWHHGVVLHQLVFLCLCHDEAEK